MCSVGAQGVIELIVVCEGLSETRFVDTVLRPALPALLVTHRNLAGNVNFQRVKKVLRNTILERTDTYVATFLDLYRLGKDFPGFAVSKLIRDPLHRCSSLEQAMTDAVVSVARCRPERFLPHIQPYEFESLLFADIEHLIRRNNDWIAQAESLRSARRKHASPEHINGGDATHPSRRLASLKPVYSKPIDGPATIEAIGLPKLREQCKHFDRWLKRLEKLKPLR